MRTTPISTVALIAFALIAFGATSAHAGATLAACTADKPACSVSFAPAPVLASGWTFYACWTYWPAGPCRDIFQDGGGAYWICQECGTTGNPSPGKCSPISPQTLNIGYWCS